MVLNLFPSDVIAAAQAIHAEFYPRGPLASVTLAQWAVESDYGKDASGTFNYFGIKATKAQIAAGQATLKMTREVIGGRSIEEPQYFANYPSVDAGFKAHGALLANNSWYKDFQVAPTASAEAEALVKDHYATAPNYATTLIVVIRQYDLAQYDTAAPIPVAAVGDATSLAVQGKLPVASDPSPSGSPSARVSDLAKAVANVSGVPPTWWAAFEAKVSALEAHVTDALSVD